VSIQLQLTDTSGAGALGSLEVLPGSHRPDARLGAPAQIREAVDAPEGARGVVPIAVPAGSVTIYSSRLWHRGGANEGGPERAFCFLTVTEPGTPAPPGLIHTISWEDVGAWMVGAEGLARRSESDAL